jgi:carbonic anhydrase/acetyltransferase-like protein (isoleucine patch superfamily)
MAIESYRGMTPKLGRDVYVHPSATVIGDVELGDAVSVWPGVVIRGDVNSIRIGAGSNIQDNAVLHVSHKSAAHPEGAPLVIGRQVSVGHGVILHGCTVGDECLIGMGALVMDWAVLPERILLGAGSLVPERRRLESGWLYLGRPAKAMRRNTAALDPEPPGIPASASMRRSAGPSRCSPGSGKLPTSGCLCQASTYCSCSGQPCKATGDWAISTGGKPCTEAGAVH